MEGVLKQATDSGGRRPLVAVGVASVPVALVGGLLARGWRRRRARRTLADRRRFESLGSELATAVLESPPADLAGRIARALQHVLVVLGVDRASLLEITADGRCAPIAHGVSRPPVPALLPAALAAQWLPWTAARLARGEVTCVSRIDDLPAEAQADRRGYQALGAVSVAVVPLAAAGSVLGARPALALDTVGREQPWPDDLGERVRPLARAFATALVRRRADALARDNDELRDALAHALRVSTMGSFAAALAHEITQPLTAIAANAAVAGRAVAGGPAEAPRLPAVVADLEQDARRALAILDHYRALFRRERAAWHPVDVGALVEGVVRLVRHDPAMRDLPLDVRLAPDVPPVQGDAVQLQQVVLNLVLNACQSVAALPRGRGGVAIESVRGEHGGAIVTVRDGGPGVPAEDLERIFEPFVTAKAGHLGLGLSISRAIVRAHGGRIRATSSPGAGLTVHVDLPPTAAAAPR
jgi:signal transduction histidine kinase